MNSGAHAVLLILCLVGGAFFAGIETGIIAINRLRLRHLVLHRVRGAKQLERFVRDPDLLLGTTLIGTNICYVVASVSAAAIGARCGGAPGVAPGRPRGPPAWAAGAVRGWASSGGGPGMSEVQGKGAGPGAGPGWAHQYAEVDGVRVHYVEAGEGPPVLLLHGLGGSLAVWWENILPLAGRFRVIALDLPGHGDSAPSRTSYRPEEGVEFLQGFLHVLGLDAVSLAGNSAGGLVAALFALASPERVERLVLVAPVGLGPELAWFVRLGSLPVLGRLLDLPAFRSPGAIRRAMLFHARSLDGALVREMARLRGLPRVRDAVYRALRACVTLRGLRREYVLLERLRRLARPLLVVWGREDRVIPVAHAARAAQVLEEAQVVVFPQCGHWPQLERAPEFNALVVRFLSGTAGQRLGAG